MFNPATSWLFKRKLPLIIICILIFLGSALVSYYFLHLSHLPKKNFASEIPDQETTQAEKDLLDLETQGLGNLEKTHNLLLLGFGGAGHDGGYLTDVIKVVNVNPEKKEIIIVSVPRDLWVDLPIRSDQSQYFKINAAYAIGHDDRGYPLKEPQYKGEEGAVRMIKETLTKVTGIPVDYYLAVDFGGFKEAIDILGGIEVNVPVTFDDYFYPIKGLENEICGKSPEEIAELHQKYSGFQLEKQFECRYEHLHFDAGMQEIDGETTLKFVRSRHSDTHGGDFARAQRQLAVMLALKNKIISIKALDDLPAFFSKFKDVVTTDLSVQVAKDVLKEIPNLTDFEVKSIHLTTENVLVESKSSSGQYILIPKEGIGKWDEVQKFIRGK